MKSKIAMATTFLAINSASVGEIVINDYLSFEGFIDMSYTHFDAEADILGSPVQESGNDFGVEEVEIVFLFDFDPVTALIDIDYERNGEEALVVEQAFVSYSFDGNLQGSKITAGLYASMLGFEAYERVGRYQYSTAYESVLLGRVIGESLFGTGFVDDADAFAYFESVLIPVGERYSQGVRYTYENENTFFGASLQDGTLNYENRLGGDSAGDDTAVDDGGYGFELAFAYDCGNGFTYFLGGSYETGDGLSSDFGSTNDTETFIINTYSTYEIGAWLFAVELNYGDTAIDDVFTLGDDADFESFTGLIMTNYAYSHQASVTGRISYIDLSTDLQSAGDNEFEVFKYTAAHNYAFTDNLLLVGELSYLDGDVEELVAAIQLLFTF